MIISLTKSQMELRLVIINKSLILEENASLSSESSIRCASKDWNDQGNVFVTVYKVPQLTAALLLFQR